MHAKGRSIVVANAGGRLYFEHHRKRGDHVVLKKEEPVDVHGGKKIVDYWEDGLAIYEDGTKQAKATVQEPQEQTQTDGKIWVAASKMINAGVGAVKYL